MDREQLCRLVDEALVDIPEKNITITLEDKDNIRILVVSDFFKGMNLSNRIDLVSEGLMDLICSDDFSDYHFIINTITENERVSGTSETLQEELDTESSKNKKIASEQPRI